MRFAGLLLFAATSSVLAQTAAAPKPVPARPATARKSAGAAAAPGVGMNAPGIPQVAGVPKTLYALKYIDTVVGTGELAVPQKWYTVNYTGWLTTGKKFDSSLDRNQPITFPYGARRVIAGWDTGFEGMRVGGKRRLLIPYQLAYGDQGKDPIPAKSTLIFDVELLGMSDTPPAPPTPPAAPAGAKPAEGTTPPPAKPAEGTPPPPEGSAPAGAEKPATPPPSKQ